MEETFWLPQQPFGVIGHMVACHKCGRKILVQMAVNGTIHHGGVSATCSDCLELTEEFKNKYPEQAKKVEDWIKPS